MKTTREEEKRRNFNTLMFAILISILINSLLTVLIILIINNSPNNSGYFCDIGKAEIAGDYYFNSQYPMDSQNCAVKDCASFNRVQIEKNSTMRCMI